MVVIFLLIVAAVIVFFIGRASVSGTGPFAILGRFLSRLGGGLRTGVDQMREDWEDAEAEIREEAKAKTKDGGP